MAGKKRPLHELVPVCRNGKAYVFRSKWVCLGKWEGDEPSAEAVARLISLKELWKILLSAPLAFVSISFTELWRDWKHSPQGPRKRPEDVRRVELSLFGTVKEPGPFLMCAAKDFAPRPFSVGKRPFARRGCPDGRWGSAAGWFSPASIGVVLSARLTNYFRPHSPA